MDEPTTPRRSRGGAIAVGIGIAAVAVALVVGLISLRDSEPVRPNLVGAETTQTTTGDTAPARPTDATAPRGKGMPIQLSGSDPATGERVTLASLTGKPVVLTIWASWCPGCNSEGPHLSRVAKRRAGEAHFFGINFRDSDPDAKRFLDKYGLTYRSVADPSGDVAYGLGLQGTPTTLFLDADHREIGRVVGPLDEDGLDDAIDQITGGA